MILVLAIAATTASHLAKVIEAMNTTRVAFFSLRSLERTGRSLRVARPGYHYYQGTPYWGILSSFFFYLFPIDHLVECAGMLCRASDGVMSRQCNDQDAAMIGTR